MIKEFKINDILRAMEAISNAKGEKREIDEKKISIVKKNATTPNNPVKSSKREILVLKEMIEQNIKTLNEKI